jgi:hypothetical protein
MTLRYRPSHLPSGRNIASRVRTASETMRSVVSEAAENASSEDAQKLNCWYVGAGVPLM